MLCRKLVKMEDQLYGESLEDSYAFQNPGCVKYLTDGTGAGGSGPLTHARSTWVCLPHVRSIWVYQLSTLFKV